MRRQLACYTTHKSWAQRSNIGTNDTDNDEKNFRARNVDSGGDVLEQRGELTKLRFTSNGASQGDRAINFRLEFA